MHGKVGTIARHGRQNLRGAASDAAGADWYVGGGPLNRRRVVSRKDQDYYRERERLPGAAGNEGEARSEAGYQQSSDSGRAGVRRNISRRLQQRQIRSGS